jgi:hypothetical protein
MDGTLSRPSGPRAVPLDMTAGIIDYEFTSKPKHGKGIRPQR